MTISVCMIVRNESAQLPHALRSIPPEYEKIVVDTGSTDDTVRVAESLGAKVHHWAWQDDFAAARNESIAHATGEYVLILDADEELAEDAPAQIEAFVREHPGEPAVVSIWNQIDGEVHRTQMVRLFPNSPSFRYQGIVHEQLFENAEPVHAVPSDISIKHIGYEKSVYEAQKKEERYLKLYGKQLTLEPNNGYLRYQIGKLHYSLQRYAEACESFRLCVGLQEEDRLYYAPMLVMYGYALKNLNRSAEAEALLTPYLSRYPSFPDLPFLLGLLAMDTMKVQDIERYFLQALEIGETSNYATVAGVGSFKAAYNVGLFYELTGQIEKARTAYEIASTYQYEPAINRLRQLPR
ncbi:glycosyltransferase family 2 protein [Cohnella lubricantis]|uniref:Glycosyltransferase n=1 Tax=Cohnella lubricantis TaxID=2163172 RepID=A0A841TEK0_9BACL|nr:glycosyltransferase family 2 protein [Cohnella lubricantis]MBB6677407.1 glycosyltransferase [Cohnella lubricantis]MBP2118702.1 glycosyltransferase involved in cell wall biosynthesis [Cohnella lubricantis]